MNGASRLVLLGLPILSVSCEQDYKISTYTDAGSTASTGPGNAAPGAGPGVGPLIPGAPGYVPPLTYNETIVSRRSVAVTPDSSETRPALSVVFVIDNSESMAGYQQKLANASAQLVDKLNTLNLDTKVTVLTTTSELHVSNQFQNNYVDFRPKGNYQRNANANPMLLHGEGIDPSRPTTSTFVPGRSMVTNYFRLDPATSHPVSTLSIDHFTLRSPSSEILASSYDPKLLLTDWLKSPMTPGGPSLEYKQFSNTQIPAKDALSGSRLEYQASMKLRDDFPTYSWSAGQGAGVRTSVLNAIQSIGTSGSRSEQGLCSMARVLNSRRSFFGPREKAVFVVLSDADDDRLAYDYQTLNYKDTDCLISTSREFLFESNLLTYAASSSEASYKVGLNVPAITVSFTYDEPTQVCSGSTGDDAIVTCVPGPDNVGKAGTLTLAWQPSFQKLNNVDVSWGLSLLPSTGPLECNSALQEGLRNNSGAYGSAKNIRSCNVTQVASKRLLWPLGPTYLYPNDPSYYTVYPLRPATDPNACAGDRSAANHPIQRAKAQVGGYQRGEDLTNSDCTYYPASSSPAQTYYDYYWRPTRYDYLSAWDALLSLPPYDRVAAANTTGSDPANPANRLPTVPWIPDLFGSQSYRKSSVPYQKGDPAAGLKNALEQGFGHDGYFVSFIVNAPGSPLCAANGAYANNYKGVGDALGDRSSMRSICDSSYTPALDELTNFVKTSVVGTINLSMMEADERLESVTLLRGSDRIPLSIGAGKDVEFDGRSLRARAGLLQTGDRFEVVLVKIAVVAKGG